MTHDGERGHSKSTATSSSFFKIEPSELISKTCFSHWTFASSLSPVRNMIHIIFLLSCVAELNQQSNFVRNLQSASTVSENMLLSCAMLSQLNTCEIAFIYSQLSCRNNVQCYWSAFPHFAPTNFLFVFYDLVLLCLFNIILNFEVFFFIIPHPHSDLHTTESPSLCCVQSSLPHGEYTLRTFMYQNKNWDLFVYPHGTLHTIIP